MSNQEIGGLNMETANHILLQKAKKTEVNDKVSMNNGVYDAVLGAWITRNGEGLLVDQPDRDKPRTKKNDVETGEDLKSE